jgi:hypothetical protein
MAALPLFNAEPSFKAPNTVGFPAAEEPAELAATVTMVGVQLTWSEYSPLFV